jgi:hypothetical protein
LLLKQPLFFSSFLFFRLLGGCQVLLSSPFIFLKLFGVSLCFHELFFKVLEYFDDSVFCALFDPLFHELSSFVLFGGLYIVDNHVVEIIT